MKVLLTGAAGFVGRAVWTHLERAGHEVVALDALIPQAHPARVSPRNDLHRIDVREAAGVLALLEAVDVVCHQAAMVGAGTRPADAPLYAGHNDLGTAVLLAAMASMRVRRLVLASSMVVYGDGRYSCRVHGDRPATRRALQSLERGDFEVGCPICGEPMRWKLVDEDAPCEPRSAYAASKLAQEHYAGAWARQLPGSVVALRYHNVYGPGMPRDTPYCGVAASFRSSLENGEPPQVFEDGAQMRDFVHVDDVARANVLAVARVLHLPADGFEVVNVCSGRPVSILDVARSLCSGTRTVQLRPEVTGEFRPGDVRHIVASPDRARETLGFVATVLPEQGLRDFANAPLRDA